jgi:hypothetical protein
MSAEMIGPRQVSLHLDLDQLDNTVVVTSDWAELLFVCWATAHHPRHSQLVTGEWLPPGWIRRAREFGCPTRLDPEHWGGGRARRQIESGGAASYSA